MPRNTYGAVATLSLDADEDVMDLADMKNEPFLSWEGFLASLTDVSVVGVKVMFVHGCARESLFTAT
jgi:hypothetical protein